MQPNDQNYEQPTQPEQPTSPPQSPQNQFAGGSSMARTLQPLSSEEDIRSAAEAASPDPRTQEDTTAASNSTAVSPSGASETYYNASTLITEPLHPQPQNAIPSLHTSPLETSPQKNSSKKILATIISLIIIGGIGFGVYHFLFSGKQLLPNADLAKETSGTTTYLRPKEWVQVSLADSTSVFGQQSNGKITAYISIQEGKSTTALKGADDETHEKVRQLMVSSASVSLMQPDFTKAGVSCISNIDFKKEADTKKANGVTGLMLAHGSCPYEGGEFTIKTRSVMGDDGRSRLITVAAQSETWTKNERTLQTILDSIGQA